MPSAAVITASGLGSGAGPCGRRRDRAYGGCVGVGDAVVVDVGVSVIDPQSSPQTRKP